MLTNKKIEEEFEEWYQANCGINSVPHPSRIKEFLLQTIQRERLNLIKEIEGMKIDDERKMHSEEENKLMADIFGTANTSNDLNVERCGYNKALSDIISHIKNGK